jgi:hypothetical protein
MSLFDSVGHDLTAGLISSVAMASCRTTRRSGGGLTDIAVDADLSERGEAAGGGSPDGGYGGAPVTGYAERLQAGDRLLLYTDGVVEGRDDDGRQFGTARLSDFVIRRSAEGLAAPEILRRLNRAVLDHQRGRLSDDATVILLEWTPGLPGDRLTL